MLANDQHKRALSYLGVRHPSSSEQRPFFSFIPGGYWEWVLPHLCCLFSPSWGPSPNPWRFRLVFRDLYLDGARILLRTPFIKPAFPFSLAPGPFLFERLQDKPLDRRKSSGLFGKRFACPSPSQPVNRFPNWPLLHPKKSHACRRCPRVTSPYGDASV